MVAYEKFHDGAMTNTIPTDEDIAQSLAKLPKAGPDRRILCSLQNASVCRFR